MWSWDIERVRGTAHTPCVFCREGGIEVCRSRVKEKWVMWSWDIERVRGTAHTPCVFCREGGIEVCRSRVKERQVRLSREGEKESS
jgi:hypothetical protein